MSMLAAVLYPPWVYIAITLLSPLWFVAVRRAVGSNTTSPSRRARLGVLLHAVIWLSAVLDQGLPRHAVAIMVIVHVLAMLSYVVLAFRHYDAERG